MPCVSADGKPTPSAEKLLESLKDKSLSDLATLVDQPLFRVRSSLRELVAAGWIQESEGRYGLTEQGARLGLDNEK